MAGNKEEIATRRKGGKSLYVRMFPPDLLRRINGVAEFIGMERDAFVTALLQQEMRRFEASQVEAGEWWKERLTHAKKK